MKKIVISWVVCVLGLVLLLAWMGRGFVPSETEGAQAPSSLINGAFTLQSAEGKTVMERNFRGRYMLIYFGYTHCPDICPTSLLLMQNALTALGPDAAKVQPIFITIDPARDTPKIVGAYASHFGDRLLGLSGTPAQIKTVAENFKVYYSKVEDKNSALGYMMDHSGFIYLMGRDGAYLAHFPYNISERELEEGLRKYVR